ncbi:hypothetical protein BZG36_05341, partial [Bifiguratus adelaidae]
MAQPAVVTYVYDVLFHLEQGNLEKCQSVLAPSCKDQKIFPHPQDVQNFLILDRVLHAVVKKVHTLEQELLRTKIAYHHQHLLAANKAASLSDDEKDKETNSSNSSPRHHVNLPVTSDDAALSALCSPSSLTSPPPLTTSPGSSLPATPEDGIWPTGGIVNPPLGFQQLPHPQSQAFQLTVMSGPDPLPTPISDNGLPFPSTHSLSPSSVPPFPPPATLTTSEVPNNSICPDCLAQATAVAKAVLEGDLSQRITCQHPQLPSSSTMAQDHPMEQMRLAVNTMADHLERITTEIIGVVKREAVEGKLGGQAMVFGYATDNSISSARPGIMRRVTAESVQFDPHNSSVATGWRTSAASSPARITDSESPSPSPSASTSLTSTNTTNPAPSSTIKVYLHEPQGVWKEFVQNLNLMARNHSDQVRDIAEVCTAVAHGDLSKKITVDAKGETLVLKNTINTMVNQLNTFASEVTRVAHDVGTEGKLGVQAQVT